MHMDETAVFCKMAQQYVDLIHVSVGTHRNPILSGEFSSLFQPHGLNMDASQAIRAAVDVPVVVVGGINDPVQAEEMIASGKCDFVALARQLTADPDFPKKAEADNEDDINPCLRCFKCFPGPLEGIDITQMHLIYGCTVNPAEFCYDFDLLNSKPGAPKKVLVVGGGLVGCETAIDMARQGYQVDIIEMGDRVAPDSYPMHRLGLLHEMEGLVTYHCSLKCLKIREHSVICENADREQVELTGDSVFYALGMRANEDTVAELSAAAEVPVSVVGDCRKAAKVYEAGRQGWEAAMRL